MCSLPKESLIDIVVLVGHDGLFAGRWAMPGQPHLDSPNLLRSTPRNMAGSGIHGTAPL
ncbi:hypothetical protein [Arthrobacter glacialis]|uniref:hypothetical protein n=1 Tax=Arthrobacter glacialis TaxID=1664 RepID=UPI0013FE4C30|nr:hypothetical protein [Arthrobacter glacialis]